MFDLAIDQTASLLQSLIAADRSDIDAAAIDAFRKLGYEGATLFHVGQRCGALDPHPIAGTPFPRDWLARYTKRGYIRYDMAAVMALRAASPFTWTEAQARFPAEKSQAFFREAREYCWPEMLICPVPGEDGDIVTVVLGMASQRLVSHAERAMAQAMACLYASLVQAPADTPVPDEALELEIRSLSRRELQCVYWVFHGKTDQEIATILTISPSTAHHHVEKAKTKLGARSRVDLARRAVQRGIIVEPRLL